MEDMVVGVKVITEGTDLYPPYEVYTYGFHLYYMGYDDSRKLLRSIISSIPTDITEFDNGNLPIDYHLYQNYPNPFNPNTTIEFNLPTRSVVTLLIYNLLGQQVKELINQKFSAGNYRVTWDGINNSGVKVSSGIYLYRIKTESFTATKKMVLLK